MTRSSTRLLLPLLCTALLGARASAATLDEQPIATLVKDTGFHGVILVARGGTVLHHQVYGLSDVEAGTATTQGTRYELGSVSKFVASLVALKLVDEGKLSLSRPIVEVLPTYRPDTGSRLTLHHLLSHTSGLPNDVITAFRKDPELARRTLPLDEAVTRYASGDLQFEPGSRFDYAHSNWILVKALIEKASGRSYAENVRALLAPLKLKDTGTFVGDFTDVPSSARGYEALQPAPKRKSVPMPEFMMCAGGAYSTAKDLLTLSRALSQGKLLSAASLKHLSTVYVPEEGYAYGGRLRSMSLGGKARPVLWLTGSNGPFKMRLSRSAADDLTVILLSHTNADLGRMGAVSEALLQALAAKPPRG